MSFTGCSLGKGQKSLTLEFFLPLSDRPCPHLTLGVLLPSDNGEDLKKKQNKTRLAWRASSITESGPHISTGIQLK